LLIIKPDLFAYFVVDLPIALNIIGYYTASRLTTPDKTRRLKPLRGEKSNVIVQAISNPVASSGVKSSQQSTITDRATGINIINLR
jgi:hypothetical protein